MIISRNTEFATMEELVLEDFNNSLDACGLDGLEYCKRCDVDYEPEWIPSELIPDELIGADTEDLTDEQDEKWAEIIVNYLDEYVALWDAMLDKKLKEQKDAIQKDVDEGKYDEYREEYKEYKSNYERRRDSAYGYAKRFNEMKDFQRMFGDGNPMTFIEWLQDNDYVEQ